MSPFDTYRAYLALKQHFSRTDYDAIKYNFKVNASVKSFEARKDRYQFQKLSKQADLLNFMVSNLMNREIQWVGDLLSEEAEAVYMSWLKRQQSLSYIFSDELTNLNSDFNQNFKVLNGQHPYLYKLYRQKVVSAETLLILDNEANFLKYWDKKLHDRTIWPTDYLKLTKYKSFFKYDEKKFHKILLDTVLAL